MLEEMCVSLHREPRREEEASPKYTAFMLGKLVNSHLDQRGSWNKWAGVDSFPQ